MKRKALVTGGCGFIGSNLTDRLVKDYDVTILDNLSSGSRKNIIHLSDIRFVKYDIGNIKGLRLALKDKDVVFHMAANPDVRKGIAQSDLDLKQETINTYRVLEVMRQNDVKEIVFASTSAIYGDHGNEILKEGSGPMLPSSLYGAGKLACEGLVSAFCHTYGLEGWIFRFANVVGKRGNHGVVYDLINKLKENPKELEILGDGEQEKPYIHVSDLINGMMFAYDDNKRFSNEKVHLYNISTDGLTKVKDIANMVTSGMGIKDTKYNYTGGKSGWPGDVPKYTLSYDKLLKLGWKAKYNSDEAIKKSIKELI